ncbi:MAG: polyphosphate kinase 1 [bacterium]|nr:polyphosphate kinase 1 [bacterium]
MLIDDSDLSLMTGEVVPDKASLNDPTLFINRELSLTAFHRRVIAQAGDPAVPLLERLRFLCISSSILDEFFEIRVGGLKEQVAFGVAEPGADGLGPTEALALCREQVLGLVRSQYRLLNETLLPALQDEGIIILRRDELDEQQREWMHDYFMREVMPVLTPIGLDSAHPFPRILNKSLNFIVTIDGKDAFGRRVNAAIVQVPENMTRLIHLPPNLSEARHGFVMLSSVIHENVQQLFPGLKIRNVDQFRVTRNSDLWFDEEAVQDFLHALKGELPGRQFAKAVRLEVADTCSEEISEFLLQQFDLASDDLYRLNGPINLTRFEQLINQIDRPDFKFETFVPGLPKKLNRRTDIFQDIQRNDILLHHPYQSFTPVLDLLRQAAADPDVLAIKMTVYRSGMDSPLGTALLEAARAGKEVTAVIELRARFDEAANIDLASRLQEAGAKVVYGIVGFKCHAKMLLIVRREGDRLRNYVHLGTGNYHMATSRLYTDFSYMTCDEEWGDDVVALFRQLTGLSRNNKLNKLVQTPFGLHNRLRELIENEIENARAGRPAAIIAKMNSLVEKRIIKSLYRASQAGVKVDLIVRGICCLRPGVPGVSDNIRVISIVGRFLEHHRVFHFHADGELITYCSSADWMPRNLFRRVETAFPIEHRKNRTRVINESLKMSLADNCQAWEMMRDGRYLRLEPGKSERHSVQLDLLEILTTVSH